MKEETRYKAVVVATIGDDYVVVKDKAHQEWTFVVGGCKMRETLEACARREFKEETGGVFEPIFPENPTFEFTSLQRSKLELMADRRQGVRVTMKYTVFTVPLGLSREQLDAKRFLFLQGHHEETDDIALMTRSELERSNMWSFMKLHVLENLP